MIKHKKTLFLSLLIGISAGFFTSYFWYGQQYPKQTLFVELINLRQDTVPLVTIEHGNDFVQETILLTQLRAGEKRIISLNHEPAKGYSIKAKLDGREIDVCVGKSSEQWHNRIVLTQNGIFGKD